MLLGLLKSIAELPVAILGIEKLGSALFALDKRLSEMELSKFPSATPSGSACAGKSSNANNPAAGIPKTCLSYKLENRLILVLGIGYGARRMPISW